MGLTPAQSDFLNWLKVSGVIDCEHSERGPDTLGARTRRVHRVTSQTMALNTCYAVTGKKLKEGELIWVEEKFNNVKDIYHYEKRVCDINTGIPGTVILKKSDCVESQMIAKAWGFYRIGQEIPRL